MKVIFQKMCSNIKLNNDSKREKSLMVIFIYFGESKVVWIFLVEKNFSLWNPWFNQAKKIKNILESAFKQLLKLKVYGVDQTLADARK